MKKLILLALVPAFLIATFAYAPEKSFAGVDLSTLNSSNSRTTTSSTSRGGFSFINFRSNTYTPKTYPVSASTCRARSLLAIFDDADLTVGRGIVLPGFIWGSCPIGAAILKVRTPPNAFGGPLDF